MNNIKHYWLYVMELNKGKYYVGLTSQIDPQHRITQHKNGFYTAQWVKKYGYKKTLQIHDLGRTTARDAHEAENRMTRDMMVQYGKENVRGGALNYSGKYFDRFGISFRDYEWEAITTVTLLMLIILALVLYKYL